MVHGISIGALKFNRGPARLRLSEGMKQLDDAVRYGGFAVVKIAYRSNPTFVVISTDPDRLHELGKLFHPSGHRLGLVYRTLGYTPKGNCDETHPW